MSNVHLGIFGCVQLRREKRASGALVDGSMVLSGSRPAANGGTALHRISWTPNEDGSVRQLWETSLDDGSSWTVLFDGLYVKVAGQQ